MKNSLYFLCLIAFLASSCQNDPNVPKDAHGGGPNSELIRNPATANLPTDTSQLARIVFEEPEFEFGTVNEGDVVDHSFKFTNTGKVPLTILSAKSSCGCTVPEWPEEPVPSGGTGVVRAKFNTTGKPNEQKKAITITANTYPNTTRIRLKGIVTPVKG